MKPVLAIAVSLIIVAAVAARLRQKPTPPRGPEGSWEPAGTN